MNPLSSSSSVEEAMVMAVFGIQANLECQAQRIVESRGGFDEKKERASKVEQWLEDQVKDLRKNSVKNNWRVTHGSREY